MHPEFGVLQLIRHEKQNNSPKICNVEKQMTSSLTQGMFWYIRVASNGLGNSFRFYTLIWETSKLTATINSFPPTNLSSLTFLQGGEEGSPAGKQQLAQTHWGLPVGIFLLPTQKKRKVVWKAVSKQYSTVNTVNRIWCLCIKIYLCLK